MIGAELQRVARDGVRGTIKIKREIRIKGRGKRRKRRRRIKSGGKDTLTPLYPWTCAEL